MSILNELRSTGLVSVIRNSNIHNIIPICKALEKGGIKAIEITAETPQVTTLIEKATKEMGNKMLIGAGTVLDPETAKSVIAAGASFVVSPTLNIETIKMVKRYGVVSIPGALTPTEILTAYEHGGDLIKVFPISAFGPQYITNIGGPLPHIPLMVTGGIDLQNLADYVRAGATAIGTGSNLVDPRKLKTEEDYENMIKEAKQYRRIFQESTIQS